MGVAILFGLRRVAALQGRKLSLIPPKQHALNGYCSFSGLLHEFECGPPAGDHPKNNTTPTIQFTKLDLSAMNGVVALVKRHFDLPKDAESSLRLGMVELMHNVIDHAKSPVGGLLAARAFEGEKDVRFALADMGVGIRTALANTTPTDSDIDAIKIAIQEGKTGKSTRNNMGAGLSNLRDVVNRNKGSLLLASGTALYELDWKENGWTERFIDLAVPCPGTLAVVRFRIDNSLYDPDEMIDADDT